VRRGEPGVGTGNDMGNGDGGAAGASEQQLQPYSGKPVDVWALGVLLFTLASGGTPPFVASSMEGLCTKIQRATLDMPSSFSRSLQELIRAMLHPEASRRITIEQASGHPFLQKPESMGGARRGGSEQAASAARDQGRFGYYGPGRR
jgi:serine/threonine protein kinase